MRVMPVILSPVLAVWFSIAAEPVSEESNEAFWQKTLGQLQNLPADDIESAKKLSEAVENSLRERPDFVRVVQRSLRQDKRDWVRRYAGLKLMYALGKDSWRDCLYMLSDPSPDVRGFARLAITKWKMQELVPCLASGLLSSRGLERLSSLRAISIHLGELGLPYYAKMLYDKDQKVACWAATSLAKCSKDDAVPHLLAYLKQRGTRRSLRPVTVAVLQTLQRLHGEPQVVPQNVPAAVRDWIKRLESSTENTRVK